MTMQRTRSAETQAVCSVCSKPRRKQQASPVAPVIFTQAVMSQTIQELGQLRQACSQPLHACLAHEQTSGVRV
jgi:hypothetical protein